MRDFMYKHILISFLSLAFGSGQGRGSDSTVGSNCSYSHFFDISGSCQGCSSTGCRTTGKPC